MNEELRKRGFISTFVLSINHDHMPGYLNSYMAVQQLHERGFTQDFVLFEHHLYRTQENVLSRRRIWIEECHRFTFPALSERRDDLVVFGLQAVSQHINGILLNHYTYTTAMPDIIREKLQAMAYYSSSDINLTRAQHNGICLTPGNVNIINGNR